MSVSVLYYEIHLHYIFKYVRKCNTILNICCVIHFITFLRWKENCCFASRFSPSKLDNLSLYEREKTYTVLHLYNVKKEQIILCFPYIFQVCCKRFINILYIYHTSANVRVLLFISCLVSFICVNKQVYIQSHYSRKNKYLTKKCKRLFLTILLLDFKILCHPACQGENFGYKTRLSIL